MPFDLGMGIGIAFTVSFTLFLLMRRLSKSTGHPLSQLEYFPETLPIHGEFEGFVLRVEMSLSGRICRVELGGPETPLALYAKRSAIAHGGWRTGDPEFDDRVSVDGDEAQCIAALDAPLRAELVAWLADGARFDSDRLTLELDAAGLQPTAVRSGIHALAHAARRLQRRGSAELRTKLADNARHDPVAAVRLRNLELAIACSLTDQLEELLDAAMRDEAPALRLLAAERAFELDLLLETRARLLTLLFRLARGRSGPEWRPRAVRALGHASSFDRARPLLLELLHDDSEDVRRAAAEALIGNGWNPEAGALALTKQDAGALSLAADGEPGEPRHRPRSKQR